MLHFKKSKELYKYALKIFPGGVNSPVRAFKVLGMTPLFIKKGKRGMIVDIDNNRYIDYCLSWGALILGHSNHFVMNKVKGALKNGTSFGLCNYLEIEMGNLITQAFPSIEKLRFVNSGTEATMSAIRVARAFTKRNKVVKFDGCYHGHSDFFLAKAGSGVTNLSASSSDGVPKSVIKDTISLPFNNYTVLEKVIKKDYKNIAAVIVEPIPANMGVILPKDDFLYKLREITKKYGIILIFDEVITGFRFCFGGTQKIFDIKPDLTTLGKIIGGGFPVGAFGGKREIMDLVAPAGNVYQAGTLSGNPVALTAGIATLNILKKRNIYQKLLEKYEILEEFFNYVDTKYNIKVNHFYGMFSFFFSNKHPENFEDVLKSNKNKFVKFYKKLLEKGIFLSPSPYETNFISFAHKKNDFQYTVKVIDDCLKTI